MGFFPAKRFSHSLLLMFSISSIFASLALAQSVEFNVKASLSDYVPKPGTVFDVPQELRQVLGSGRILISAKVGGETALIAVEGSKVVETTASDSTRTPDFTVQASRSAFLSIVNSADAAKTVKLLLFKGNIVVTASDPAKQAAIKAVLSSGVISEDQLSEGSKIVINGREGSLKAFAGTLLRARIGSDDIVVNKFGGLVGALSPRHDFYSKPPARIPVFFNKPPGVLAHVPRTLYDNVTDNPNVVGPHNIFKVNPGLIGPNDILRLNPGLIGPADMALLNPNLRGPAEFAYFMGIGAHSNTAQHLLGKNLLPVDISNRLGNTNRWGNRR
ncbi:MAG TPA: hypothetical protein VJA40_05780 [archaeon]|nr:hypothetical protein [archaeon]